MKYKIFRKQPIFAKKVSLYIALLFDGKGTILVGAKLSEKGKPIALSFDEKSAITERSNFSENGEPIALLFDEKSAL